MREMKMVGRRAVQSGKQSLAPLARAGIYFRTNRPCRLPPAHQGMKIEAPVGGSVPVSLAPLTPPLDSGPVSGCGTCFRRNDRARRGGRAPTGVTETIYFRTNRSCRLVPAHSRYENRAALVGGSVLGFIGATPGFRLPPE